MKKTTKGAMYNNVAYCQDQGAGVETATGQYSGIGEEEYMVSHSEPNDYVDCSGKHVTENGHVSEEEYDDVYQYDQEETYAEITAPVRKQIIERDGVTQPRKTPVPIARTVPSPKTKVEGDEVSIRKYVVCAIAVCIIVGLTGAVIHLMIGMNKLSSELDDFKLHTPGLQADCIDEKELNRKLMAMRQLIDDKGHNNSVVLTAALERLDQSVASDISLLNRSAIAKGKEVRTYTDQKIADLQGSLPTALLHECSECRNASPCSTSDLDTDDRMSFWQCPEGFIKTEGYPVTNYTSNQLHTWSFYLNNRYSEMQITLQQFEMESSIGCGYDYLQVNQFPRLCGTKPANQTLTYDIKNSFAVTMTFKTDDTKTGKGFELHFKFA